MNHAFRLLRNALLTALAGAVAGAAAMLAAYWLFAPRLPPVDSLKDIQLQVPLRVLSSDDKLMAVFGENRRIPVTIAQVPPVLKNAVLAAEDADFYHHSGIDIKGTLRAALRVALAGGRKVEGGSTITQQVARRFFLSPQKTYTRKITEIFTSLRIEKELSKDQILELYLNKMFFGHRNYGVAAAAQYYYGKPLAELSVAQAAMLASSLQRPSLVNPLDGGQRAVARRNWVLGQMRAENQISAQEYEAAIQAPMSAAPHEAPIEVHAPYLAEMVRREAIRLLGSEALTGGYVVHTTLDVERQHEARQALRKGLVDYDRRHGYRGAEGHVDLPADATAATYVKALADFRTVANLQPALVLSSNAQQATLRLKNGEDATLLLAGARWARPFRSHDSVGPAPTALDRVVQRGDIVRLTPGKDGWGLAQVPAATAAIVSIDPENGAILALVGGFDFGSSKYNRVLMPGSGRQPGSSFKPFIYSAALDHGFTPASIINDAPVVFPDPSRPGGKWTPGNDDGRFLGPIPLRQALYRSRNLVSVRLLANIGLPFARDYITRFGFQRDQLPNSLSLALGTASVSPLNMARGYAVFANGGYLVQPYFISSIEDRSGAPIYAAQPPRACANCEQRLLQGNQPLASTDGLNTEQDPDLLLPATATTGAPAAAGSATGPATAAPGAAVRLAPDVIDVRTAYLVTSMLQDVIKRGTGHRAAALGRSDLAGKTGTTNDHHDAWFVGFNADLVTAVWVGFDNYESLGRREFGAVAALPIWMDYMGAALDHGKPATLPRPPGITTVTVDPRTGLPAAGGVSELFKVEDVDRLRRQAQLEQQNRQQELLDIF